MLICRVANIAVLLLLQYLWGKWRDIIKYRDCLPWGVQKTAEPIEIPFEMWTRVGPRKHVLYGVHIGAT